MVMPNSMMPNRITARTGNRTASSTARTPSSRRRSLLNIRNTLRRPPGPWATSRSTFIGPSLPRPLAEGESGRRGRSLLLTGGAQVRHAGAGRLQLVVDADTKGGGSDHDRERDEHQQDDVLRREDAVLVAHAGLEAAPDTHEPRVKAKKHSSFHPLPTLRRGRPPN